jgi:ferredoxin
MLLTLGVKNLFGCVVGLRKPEWHFRAGVDRELFARLLVGIYDVIRPSVTILDGILAMEGQGPGTGGTPRQLGVLMASDDAVALDKTVCTMLGVDPDRLFTHRAAGARGLDTACTVEGVIPRVQDFKLPELVPLYFGPAYFHGFLRKHLLQRPAVDDNRCKQCGTCWTYCPAQAIRQSDRTLSPCGTAFRRAAGRRHHTKTLPHARHQKEVVPERSKPQGKHPYISLLTCLYLSYASGGTFFHFPFSISYFPLVFICIMKS